jgi:uncharacterized protein YgiM (DUF1202 family)
MAKIGKTCKILCIAAFLMMGSILSSLPSAVNAAYKFNMGDRVYTTANLHVREGPGLSYTIIATELQGSKGVVVCSKPQSGDGYVWWVVKYGDGTRGWSVEDGLEKTGSLSVITNLQVPYIHQCYDTRDSFDGRWACGATSAVMVLAYYGKINAWPYSCSYPYPHVSDYGSYVSEQYTSCAGYTFGDDPDEVTPDASGNPAKGAYGYIHYPDGLAKLDRMVNYFQKHELDSQEKYYPSELDVKTELNSGYPVPASTKLTSAGHWVVIKGYTEGGYYIVDDPNGCKPYKGDTVWGLNFNYCGEDVLYTWDEMEVGEKWIAIVHSVTNNPPNQPTASSQLRSDGITVIPEGGMTPESTVVFKGTVSDPDGDYVRLEIELRQISEAFTGEPTSETISDFVPSGTEVTITRYGLVNADYHWQYRAKDSRGATSSWVEFGAPGNIDFTVHLNNPPNTPSSPSPSNHATGVSIAADLSWNGGDPDAGDTVTYDVYFGTSATPPLVSNDQLATTYDLGTLSYSTTYYWKIVATDNHGSSTEGTIWDFTTQSAPNLPPNQPSNVLPSDGATGVELTPTLKSSVFSDPNPGDVHAASQWQITTIRGDYFSPIFDSGTDNVNLIQISIPSGTLGYSTTYYWRVRHQDNHGAWSEWSVETSFTTISPTLHDVAILNVEVQPTQVFQGSTVNIAVVACNEGTETEVFNVTVYVNTTVIQTTTVTLASKNSVTVTITWSTAGFAKGDYIISAYARPVSGESDTADNTFVDGVVKVKMLGDVNGDEKVDYWDLFLLARAYGSVEGDPNWNEQADFNSDGWVNYMDLYILARNYGTSGS